MIVVTTLVVGAVASALFIAVVIASWWRDPQIWIADLTDGKEPAPRSTALYVWTGLIMAITFVGPLTAAWISAADQGASFWSRIVVAWSVVAIVSLVDLVVVDIAIYIWWAPSWMIIPGYEPQRSLWFHTKASLFGLAIGMPIALVAAAATALV